MVSIETLRESFRLDESGRLFWLVSNTNRIRVGEQAGTRSDEGYIVLMIQRQRIPAHRIVFAMTHGRWPVGEVDHINRVRDDNRPCNLREASKSQNQMNRPVSPLSGTGVKGVGWCKKSNRWRARIALNGKRVSVGLFDTIAEAAEAYAAASKSLHGQFAKGAA
ncbi:MAG: hypothetical protein A3E01_04660 [Gammaproteobacteria bacterium RIFCSPHIGHO2_12_FULL_63_22]|nr:MAG: hypothetical protein A3E01_04660 [Gammaproteobacteria bacterium RIFCSPHIGHO2_12_FULL_63_22]